MTVLQEKDSSGNTHVQCRYCERAFWGNATRIQAHLAGTEGCGIEPCASCPSELRTELAEKITADLALKKRKQSQLNLSRSHSDSVLDLSHDSEGGPSKQPRQGTLKTIFAKQQKVQVDAAVARFFYATGCSLNRARSVYFDEMLAAVGQYGPSYRKPNINQLREGLLDAEKLAVQQQIKDTVLDCMPQTGCTIASDG